MNLQERISSVQERVRAAAIAAGRDPSEITLCAATKTQDDDTIRAAIAAGIRFCGENRVQELTAHLQADAYAGSRVHFIGHLQTNKVNKVVGKVDLIHSVDSLHLLQAIDRQAEKLGIRQDVLLEINIGSEESKGGIPRGEAEDLALRAAAMEHVRLRGLMAIPPICTQPGGNLPYFREMSRLFVDIKGKMSDNQEEMTDLSMGMSRDFEDAIAMGSTLVRVGTAIFGPRPPMAPAAPGK